MKFVPAVPELFLHDPDWVLLNYIFHPILCTSVEVFKYAYVSRAVNQRSGNPAFLPVIYEKCCNYDLDGDVSPARTKALMRLWVTCDVSQ